MEENKRNNKFEFSFSYLEYDKILLSNFVITRRLKAKIKTNRLNKGGRNQARFQLNRGFMIKKILLPCKKTPENYKNETTKEHFISSSNKIQFRIPESYKGANEINKQQHYTVKKKEKKKEKGEKEKALCNPCFGSSSLQP